MIDITFGWDTVFLLRTSEVDKAIVDSGSIPKAFEFADPDGEFVLKGQFDPWRIAPGGSGKKLNLYVPVSKLEAQLGTGKTVEMPTELTALVQVELDFFENNPRPDGRKDMDLKVKTEGMRPISLLSLRSSELSPLQSIISHEAFEEFLNQHVNIFNQILTTVSLEEVASHEPFAWMKPTSVSYAYVEKVDQAGKYVEGSGYLGVLSMTEGRSKENLSEQVSPDAIPEGKDATFLIGRQVFLEKLLFPSVIHSFSDGKVFRGGKSVNGGPSLVFHASRDLIRMERGSSIKKRVTDEKGHTHEVEITNMEIRLEDTDLVIFAETVEDAGNWQFVHTRSMHKYALELGAVQGGQSIRYKEIGKPSIQHWTEDRSPIYMKIIPLAIAVIGIIAAIAITVLTSGIAMFVGLAIVGLVVGLVLMESKIWATVNKNNAPDLGKWLAQVNEPMVWPNGTRFSVEQLQLKGGLQFFGHFR